MKRQSGSTTVELAVVTFALLVVLLAAVETSRLLFAWNALGTITQRGARLAAVCPPDTSAVGRMAMFRGAEDSRGVLPDLSEENLQISYLDGNLSDTGGTYPIRFVRARIVDYRYRIAIPFIPQALIPSPDFSTTLPAESLGYVPDTGERSCFDA